MLKSDARRSACIPSCVLPGELVIDASSRKVDKDIVIINTIAEQSHYTAAVKRYVAVVLYFLFSACQSVVILRPPNSVVYRLFCYVLR